MELTKRIPLFLVFVSALMTGCSTSSPATLLHIADGGILSDQPCSAPCFWGIHPGLTTKAEALEILQGHGASGPQQHANLVSYGHSLAFRYDQNGVVDRVYFAPDSPIAVGAVVAKHGPPDAIEVRYDPTSLPEHPMFDMALYYDALHMRVGLERQDAWPAPTLGQDTPITEVVYLAEGAYDAAKKANAHLTEWKGYGPYEDPHP